MGRWANAVVAASAPYELLKYRDPFDSQWTMKVVKVQAEDETYQFQYTGIAGEEILPPKPLRFMTLCRESVGARGPYYEDYNGKLYAIFYKVANKATVWYNPRAFAAANYTVPKSWNDMTRLAETIVADGHAPFSIVAPSGPGSGWALTDWISEILLNNCGPDLYDKWVTGEISWTDACIKQSFEMFDEIVAFSGISEFIDAVRILKQEQLIRHQFQLCLGQTQRHDPSRFAEVVRLDVIAARSSSVPDHPGVPQCHLRDRPLPGRPVRPGRRSPSGCRRPGRVARPGSDGRRTWRGWGWRRWASRSAGNSWYRGARRSCSCR